MALEYEQGSLKDLEKIAAFNEKIFSGMYDHGPYTLKDYTNRLREKKPLIYLVYSEKILVGNSISYADDLSWYLWILGVDYKERKKGIGNELIERNEKYAKKQKFEKVTAKVYNVSPAMQRLLIKRGYHITKIIPSEKDTKYNAIWFNLKLQKN